MSSRPGVRPPPKTHTVADPFGLRAADEHDQPGDDDQPTGRVSTPARVGLGALAVVLIAAVLAAGAAGLLVAVSAIAAGTVLVIAFAVPGEPARRARRRPAPPVDNAPFHAFRQIAEQLSWAAVSHRHYDAVTRPLFTRLAAARLADRYRIDLYADPAAARDVVGEDVWPWLDPVRDPSRDSQPPGVDRHTLTRIIERLESL